MSLADDFHEELASKSQEPKMRDIGENQQTKVRSTESDPILELISRIWYSSRWFLLLLGLLILAFRLTNSMDPNWGRLTNSNNNLVTFFQESLWPPDWTVIEAQAYPPCMAAPELSFTCSTAWQGMIETLKIAFVATILGMIISFPLSLLASRNLSSPIGVSSLARILLAGARSLPSIIWALFFVIVIGFGPLSGILAMTVYTIGYLGKLQYETIEGIDRGPLEASKAMGHGWLERSFGVILPESANGLISQVIFMFEYNFRHGTVIGIVGAGGIGYYINLYLKFLQYDKVIAYLIIIFIVVLILDVISIYARSLFTEENDVQRPSWWSIFLPPSMLKKQE